jgi:hypothetical protein
MGLATVVVAGVQFARRVVGSMHGQWTISGGRLQLLCGAFEAFKWHAQLERRCCCSTMGQASPLTCWVVCASVQEDDRP